MDKQTLELILRLFSSLILISDILIVVVLFLFAVYRAQSKKGFLFGLFNFLSENVLSLAFLVALSATLGSYFLSEIAKYPPCALCWYQRIFMFPQPIILGIGLLKNDKSAKLYSGVLALVGFMIAIYHIIVQSSLLPAPCSVDSVNCATKQFVYFGYVTIPVMSATAFASIILLLFLDWKKKQVLK